MAIGSVYRPFLEIAREAGVDVARVLARAGLAEAQILDPGTRLSPDQGRHLARVLLAEVNDPTIGLRAAERVRFSDVDLFGYIFRHSPHPLAAIEHFARYSRLLGDTADAKVERAGGRVTIDFGLSDGRQMIPEGSDYVLAVIFRFVREASQGRAHPIEVRLPRLRPRRSAAYRRYFDCPVAFGADRSALVYREACVTVPFPESDPRLLAILEARAADVMSALPRTGTLAERVRSHIRRHLENGHRNLGAVAQELAMSERTLRRRLSQSGLSYRAILDDVRRERAVALVEQGGHAVFAIAQSVGFADATAFARAFRRWTGAAPHEYRAR